MKTKLSKIMPEQRVDEFLAIGKPKKVKVSEYFLKAGEIPFKIAWVSTGLFRYVYINDNGDQFTKGIIQEANFLSSYSAMITGSPSYFFIEALEDSEIFEVQFAAFQELMNKDGYWVKFLLKMVEKGFMIKEKRERDLLLLDAETRYQHFLKEFPGLDQRIKQTIIASYLGIKPETLSRIRKKMVFLT